MTFLWSVLYLCCKHCVWIRAICIKRKKQFWKEKTVTSIKKDKSNIFLPQFSHKNMAKEVIHNSVIQNTPDKYHPKTGSREYGTSNNF